MASRASRSPTNVKKLVTKKPPRSKLKAKDSNDVYNTDFGESVINVQTENGFPDRVSVSLGLDIEIRKYEKKAKLYFSYSTDVGHYDKKETVGQAIKRADKLVQDKIKFDVAQIIKSKKGE